ncbi:MAG TPA: Asp-tRNA(Asn)/Glu-tRNA(Gln) amidotransferase subunit GatB [Candidatus Pacearchaeota archaeon]|nr:Asp-tRNA(Asn)/Glu-tRNA(Gln) amidotransferase subunit GatB [Candidatus Pacearchaeota archaeon]
MTKIGLEIHGYLNTKEKLFCKCKALHGAKIAKPNTSICPICTGQPGAKPMLPNKTAIDNVIKISMILGCKINKKLIWQRKHYDWADLPKGYQNTISGSNSVPIGEKGEFLGIKIRGAHLEEDPAAWNPKTGEIDYNKSGTPLVEIVTDPDFTEPQQVIDWLKQLVITLGYVKAIDNNAGIKADVNISTEGERVEIKNVNSLKNIKAALEYELIRQKKEKPLVKETRMFDETEGKTIKMREKETEKDYRFISDPDLPMIQLSEERIKKIKEIVPETPQEKLKKLIAKNNIDKNSAEVLSKKIEIAQFFEEVAKKIDAKFAVPWITIELLRVLNYNKSSLDSPEVEIKPEHFIELLQLLKQQKITEQQAKKMLNDFFPKSFSPSTKVKGNEKITDEKEIENITEKVLKENKKAVTDYLAGEESALNFLIGQIMKESRGRADIKIIRKIITKKIN